MSVTSITSSSTTTTIQPALVSGPITTDPAPTDPTPAPDEPVKVTIGKGHADLGLYGPGSKSRSGLADGTNPGQSAGRANSPNEGTLNPNNSQVA